MNEFSVKIVMLLLPGMVTTMLINRFTEHKAWNNFKYTLLIIFYGVLSYIFLQILYSIYQCVTEGLNNIHSISDIKILESFRLNEKHWQKIPYLEIIFATMFSFLLGISILKIEKNNYFNQLLLKFNITSKYGDYSIFHYFAENTTGQDIYVIHFKNNQIYDGQIISINEQKNGCEIFLQNVTVYLIKDEEGNYSKELYTVKYLALYGNFEDMILTTKPEGNNDEK